MLFNTVDIEGVAFYQLKKLDHLSDQLAFEHRFEKKRWMFFGPVMAFVGLLIMISWIVVPAFATSTQFFQHFKTVFDVTGFVVVLLVWVLGSTIVGGILAFLGMTTSDTPNKGQGRRIGFTLGVYPRDKLLSSLDFAFPMLRDLIEASSNKEEKQHIEAFFRREEIVFLNEQLANNFPIAERREQMLKLIDAVQQFATETPFATFTDFDQLRRQVETDFQASVVARINKKKATLERLQALVN